MKFNPVPKPLKRKKITKDELVTPKKIALESIPDESDEQSTVADWLDIHKVFYTATMAGSYLHPATYNRMKRMGLKKGVSDFLIFTKPPAYFMDEVKQYKYCGVCLEMKRKKGGIISDDQKQWLYKMALLGWLPFVANGADEAINFLEQCGYGGKSKLKDII